MRIGVLSDTHGLLRPEVFDVFSGVDHILHGGDVGREAILDELQAIASDRGLWQHRRLGAAHTGSARVARVELDGFTIIVTHGDQLGSPTPDRLQAEFPYAEIIVFGHTHRPVLTLVDTVVTGDESGRRGTSAVRSSRVGRILARARHPPRGRLVPLTPADADQPDALLLAAALAALQGAAVPPDHGDSLAIRDVPTAPSAQARPDTVGWGTPQVTLETRQAARWCG